MNRNFIIVNSITLIRVIGALFLVPIYLLWGSFGLAIAVLIFISTDSIDGFLARKLHASTFFGAAFDALSDKLFNIVVLAIVSFIEPKMLFVLLFELGILCIGIHSSFKGNNSKTLILGKVKMVILSLTIISILFLDSYPKLMEMFNLPSINYKNLINILSIFNIIFDGVTFIVYLIRDTINTLNNKEVKETVFQKKLKSKKEIKNMLFSNEFYKENKDVPIEKLVLKK